MFQLVCLVIGLVAGMALTGRLSPLLLKRWRALPVLPLILLVALAPPVLSIVSPALIWTKSRLLYQLLVACRYLGCLFFLIDNIWPRRSHHIDHVLADQTIRRASRPLLSWLQRIPLIIVCLGLIGELAVFLANRGYMPVSANLLDHLTDPVKIVGFRNQALLTRQLIDSQTRLAWLGQVWYCPFLTTLRLASVPYLSPAEAASALGLALAGFTQFFDSAHNFYDRIQIKRFAAGFAKKWQRFAGHVKEGIHLMAHRPFFSRPDGMYLKKIDPFMRFFPFIMKGRNESAIYFRQQIDMTALKSYLGEKNREIAANGQGSKSTIFHAVLAALVKTAVERPQVNRFVIGRRIYQRNDISVAFVIKSEFRDDANEEVAVMKFKPDDTLPIISERLQKEIRRVRDEVKKNKAKRHGAVDWLNYFMKVPRIILRGLIRFLGFLDYHGWLPRFIIDVDPMHTSVFVTNLGSLNVDAPFHHLYEWGTTSSFMTIGVVMKAPVVTAEGAIEVREVMNVGLTMDERISDGYYFSKTIKRFQYFLEHPAELETPAVPGRK